MSNGTLLIAKGNRMPFIIISKVKINRSCTNQGFPFILNGIQIGHLEDFEIEIDGYKVTRCDRINQPFVVDEEDFAARFEVVA